VHECLAIYFKLMVLHFLPCT